MKWYQRLTSKVKMATKGAYNGWKGSGYNFSNWMGKTFWGIDNSKLATNETIFSVVSRLSNTMSTLPLKLYKNYDIVLNQSADVLVNEPNQNMHSFDFINKMEVDRNEHGNAYAVIMRDIRMQVESLVPIEPELVTPFINNDDGVLWYEFRGNGGTFYFHNMNILHFKHITGSTRWQGLSPLDILKNTLEYDKSVQEFSLSEMQKRESFTITYGSNIDEKKKSEVTQNFREFYKHNGGILFREPGVEIDPIEKKYFASDTLQSEKITRARVANVFNVPVSFLNEAEGSSYSSNEQLMTQFVQMTLTPIARQYEQEFNRKLLTEAERLSGHYFKFNLGGLMRGDTAARTSFYQMMIRSGGMKPNEVRRLEDLPPEKGTAANTLWISGDLYPIDTPIAERKGTTLKVGVSGDE